MNPDMEPIAIRKRRDGPNVMMPRAAVDKLNPPKGATIFYAFDPEKKAIIVSLDPGVMA